MGRRADPVPKELRFEDRCYKTTRNYRPSWNESHEKKDAGENERSISRAGEGGRGHASSRRL